MWHAVDTWLQLVDAHLTRYPLMELRDVYKLLYQGVLGPEHLIAAPGVFAARLWLEYESVRAAAAEPLYESVRPDGRLLRVNLRPFKARGGDLDRLISICQEAATEHWGTSDDLRAAWATIADVYRTGWQPRLAAEVAFSAWLDVHSYPAVHHSAQYREAYRPAYRLVNRAACNVLFGDPSRLAQAIVTMPDNEGTP